MFDLSVFSKLTFHDQASIMASPLSSTDESESTTGDSCKNKKRSVSKVTLNSWSSKLTQTFEFKFDDSGTKAIKAVGKVCSKHWPKIAAQQYRGKLVTDVMTYGKPPSWLKKMT